MPILDFNPNAEVFAMVPAAPKETTQIVRTVIPSVFTGGDIIQLFLDDLALRRTQGRVSKEHFENYQRSLVSGGTRYVGFTDIIGYKSVDSLCQQDLTDWLNSNPQWKSPETRRNNLAAVFACFHWAASEARLLKATPYHKTRRLREPRSERREATNDEMKAIFEVASDSLRRIIWFIEQTGVRTCEARALRWEFIDWENGVATLEHHKTRHQTQEARFIGLSAEVMTQLRTWFDERDQDQPHVFTTERGVPWTKNNLGQSFRTARKSAGLPDDLVPYGFRHKFATDGIIAGMNERDVGDLLGHRSSATTRRYTHTLGKSWRLKELADAAAQARAARTAKVEATAEVSLF